MHFLTLKNDFSVKMYTKKNWLSKWENLIKVPLRMLKTDLPLMITAIWK